MNRLESFYKGKLMAQLRLSFPGFVLLRHEDMAMSGLPDIEILGNGRCSYWEAKHATPRFEKKAIQTLTMTRMNRAGIHARYIIWEEHHDIKRTLIVHPSMINEWTARQETVASGIDHLAIVEAIRKVHK